MKLEVVEKGLTKSFEHIFLRSWSKARKSLYFSDCDSLLKLEERESDI